MYAFKHQKVRSVSEAENVLASCPDARILAGGQSLIAMMKLRLVDAPLLVDLGAVDDLRGISVSGRAVTIGAMTRHAEVGSSEILGTTLPALRSLALCIGDRMVRNMGTIGGSVANNDPAADYPASLLALNATVMTSRRTIPGDAFFTGMYETALEHGEIIKAIAFEIPDRAAYVKLKNPASRFAIVGVFVADFGKSVRVAVTGAAAQVFRVPEMERALETAFVPAAIAGIQVPADALNSDAHAGSEYRSHLVTVMAKRAVEAATG